MEEMALGLNFDESLSLLKYSLQIVVRNRNFHIDVKEIFDISRT
jgi:hypothetical protein